MKRINLSFFGFFFSLIYLEILFKILLNISFSLDSLTIILLNSLSLSIILYFVNLLYKKNNILYLILIFIISIYFISELLVYKMFGFYYDLGILDQAKQIGAFWYDTLVLIYHNILNILILFVPLIINIVLIKKYNIDTYKLKTTILLITLFFVCNCCLFSYLYLKKDDINSSYYLAFKTKNTDLAIPRIGLLFNFETDAYKHISNFQETPNFTIDDEIIPDNIEDTFNILNIDFESLSKSETDETLKQMHTYFSSLTGTKTNDYTGLFKDKNLIVIVAESFSKLAVKQDLTPTLYKLVNDGFVFNNYYSTSMYSTVGGELQFNTSLYPLSGLTDIWKSGKNYFPMGLAKQFKNNNYSTFAYHDNTYNYLDRNKYLNSIGFDNYIGCYNGLEKRMNCNAWTESDIELIDVTFDDYINEEKFMTYYMSVSGHGLYTFDDSVNSMGNKYKDVIYSKGYNYSEPVTAYLSSQIELDKALELLITKLDEASKLDDTVIVVVPDHYPYYLEANELDELAGKALEQYIEVCENNLIIYNPLIDKTQINKVCSTIDVLPTIYNLFGIEYDSRLFIGSDIFSDSNGYAIFGNNSWVSDKGIYYAANNKFINTVNVDDDYLLKTNSIIKDKINVSLLIGKNDYYRLVWPK